MWPWGMSWVDQGQNQKMPVRALRPSPGPLHPARVQASESKNARKGIKTGSHRQGCDVVEICQNQKMPVRALRHKPEEKTYFTRRITSESKNARKGIKTFHLPGEYVTSFSQNQKMPVRALRHFPFYRTHVNLQ